MDVKTLCSEIDELEIKINQMREVLIQIAAETGINSNDTLSYSQKLDALIAEYQKLKMGSDPFIK